MKIYDITAEVSRSLPFYSDNDPFDFKHVLQIKNGDVCNLSRVIMSTHTGTHADMPLHFIDGGTACHNTPLEHFYGPAKLFRLWPVPVRNITREDLLPLDIQAGDIVLLDAGQSKYMRQSLKKDYLALDPGAAKYLAEKKVKTLGVDYISVDVYGGANAFNRENAPNPGPDFPVHKILLGSGVAILEGLVLEGVPQGEYILSALPLKFKDGDGSPVRAVLVAAG